MEWSGVEWSGVAWRGVAWRGVAWRGVAWRGVAWRGVAWRGVAWRGVAWRGVAWRGAARRGVEWSGVEWSGRLICCMYIKKNLYAFFNHFLGHICLLGVKIGIQDQLLCLELSTRQCSWSWVNLVRQVKRSAKMWKGT